MENVQALTLFMYCRLAAVRFFHIYRSVKEFWNFTGGVAMLTSVKEGTRCSSVQLR